MYKYDAIDRQLINERVEQFRDQVSRWQAGELADDEFRPLRLQNGLYIQRHAPMFRIAVPYGMLNAAQLRRMAHVARKYDHGYGHFTTRHNLQLNWPKIEDVPDILAELAEVEMHAIQTSGNCLRNITTDQFAGVAADEIIDPRPLAEILRQWTTFHPEFAFLPRKFKIAISGTEQDRAVTWFHDIGLHLKVVDGQVGFTVIVGGGLGRTPIRGEVVRDFLPWQDILTYCEAILRVYNRAGRRDNAYKARIKILVQALGVDAFAKLVEEEWAHGKGGPATITQAEYDRIAAHFTAPAYESLGETALPEEKAFRRWVDRCTQPHKVAGYTAVTLSLKAHGVAPGDITSEQMEVVADLADRYSFGELRISHEQNIILADVKQADLYAVWQIAKENGLATPNIGLLTSMICCPGGDFCDLANAKSIPIATAIQARFDNLDYLFDIGEIDLNISGCMNACGHHHVGHIGVLGVDKNNDEFYQVTLGGRQGNQAKLGKVIGPSFAANEMPDVVEKIIKVYLEQRSDEERFLDTFDRIGIDPFKNRVYEGRAHGKAKAADKETA
ncbi:nitrite/sulfite reductase [Quatrionicoccus australiensis]|uniref:nitrite/sulfite reductase n=1 Tax=Quatrionicoccus australiensis TaxID=138118 RepID=UPI001CFB3EEC|nr:nitrite/sulfite reductase [Quatrionicoccus australiensis]MCB4361449.1 nitrite/sulfite reductase [Quatrionicoccus australiensis]